MKIKSGQVWCRFDMIKDQTYHYKIGLYDPINNRWSIVGGNLWFNSKDLDGINYICLSTPEYLTRFELIIKETL